MATTGIRDSTPERNVEEQKGPNYDLLHEHQQNNPAAEEEVVDKFIATLPKVKGLLAKDLHKYNGFWVPSRFLRGLILAQNNFILKSDHIILATFPKAGTTWLEALLSSIINHTNTKTNKSSSRHDDDEAINPSKNPQDTVPRIETYALANPSNPVQPDTSLYATHVPYALLPESIIKSSCAHPPIIYVCRNPKDLFVSLWHFTCKIRSVRQQEEVPLDEAFDFFMKGLSPFGPYWDHVLEYWKLSLEFPEKVMFVKYEEMKREPVHNVKRIAEFIGHGFSADEEKSGIVEEIVRACSFENMKKVGDKEGEVVKNIIPNSGGQLPSNVFFRKGSVGDYNNYLTNDMIIRIESVTKEKLQGTGLTLLDE